MFSIIVKNELQCYIRCIDTSTVGDFSHNHNPANTHSVTRVTIF